MPGAAIDALRAFLKGPGADGKRGKLIALLNPGEPGGPAYDDPGLEGLLAEYDVQPRPRPHPHPQPGGPDAGPGQRRPGKRQPHCARVRPDRRRSPLQERPDGASRDDQSPRTGRRHCSSPTPQYLPWAQKDLRADPSALAVAARKEAEQRKFDRFAKTPLPVAVAVTEAQGAPPIPGHEFLGPQPGKPVLAVYGDANWISNETLAGPDQGLPFSLFKSTVDWMRERATIGEQVKSKTGTEREEFSLAKVTPSAWWGIVVWTGFTMLAGVLVLGLGMALVPPPLTRDG